MSLCVCMVGWVGGCGNGGQAASLNVCVRPKDRSWPGGRDWLSSVTLLGKLG